MREAELRVTTIHGVTTVSIHLSTYSRAMHGDPVARSVIARAVRENLIAQSGVEVPELNWCLSIEENGMRVEQIGSSQHHFNPTESIHHKQASSLARLRDSLPGLSEYISEKT